MFAADVVDAVGSLETQIKQRGVTGNNGGAALCSDEK